MHNSSSSEMSGRSASSELTNTTTATSAVSTQYSEYSLELPVIPDSPVYAVVVPSSQRQGRRPIDTMQQLNEMLAQMHNNFANLPENEESGASDVEIGDNLAFRNLMMDEDEVAESLSESVIEAPENLLAELLPGGQPPKKMAAVKGALSSGWKKMKKLFQKKQSGQPSTSNADVEMYHEPTTVRFAEKTEIIPDDTDRRSWDEEGDLISLDYDDLTPLI